MVALLATRLLYGFLGVVVLVWAMPPVVAVQVWLWMTNFQNGVVNYILTEAHVGEFKQHDWYATTFSQLTPSISISIAGSNEPFTTFPRLSKQLFHSSSSPSLRSPRRPD